MYAMARSELFLKNNKYFFQVTISHFSLLDKTQNYC